MLEALALTLGIAVLAVLLLLVLTRFISGERREPHNDVTGFVYAVIGVIYAVVLAMVVIGTWETLDEAKTNTYTEADAVIDLYNYGKTLPSSERATIDGLATRYTRTVIDQEWPLLARQQSSPAAWNQAAALYDAVEAQQPQTPAAQARYQRALDAADQFGDARRARIEQASDGVPTPLWAALVLGGVVTIGYSFGFGMRSLWAHAAIVFSATLVIASLLILIAELNFPFAPPVRVEPDAFQLALQQMSDGS